MKVDSKLLEKYYADKRMSASGIKEFDLCPKKYSYDKIEKLPGLFHDYFEIGKRVEETVFRMLGAELTGYDELPNESEKAMANAIYNFAPFRKLIEGKELKFQVEHYSDELKGLTDIETDTDVIDLKTSASTWNDDMVREMKYQAKIYTRLTGKQFWFVVLNKKTLGVQLIKVHVKDFDDLYLKIEELNLAIELGIFQPIPSFKCRWCDFKSTCESDRGFRN